MLTDLPPTPPIKTIIYHTRRLTSVSLNKCFYLREVISTIFIDFTVSEIFVMRTTSLISQTISQRGTFAHNRLIEGSRKKCGFLGVMPPEFAGR